MTNYYFTERGDYGLKESLPEGTLGWIAIPTSSWTPSMWEVMETKAPNGRWDLAKHFNINVHRIFTGKCQICKLSIDELDGQHVVDKDN